jgi:hypothetical protein
MGGVDRHTPKDLIAIFCLATGTDFVPEQNYPLHFLNFAKSLSHGSMQK